MSKSNFYISRAQLLADNKRLTDEVARLRQALDDVVNPLNSLRRYAKETGRELNGSAWSIANDLHFVQNIAKTALR